MQRRLFSIPLALMFFAITFGVVYAQEPVHAEAPAPTAIQEPAPSVPEQVAAPVKAPPFSDIVKQLSWKTFHTNLYLDVARKGKSPSRKMMEVYLRHSKTGQDMFMVFKKPSNMKGMTFLAHNNVDLDDDWYMYVRTIRRVKRVPSAADNFMLRDFLSLYLLKPRLELWDYTVDGSVPAEDGKGVWHKYVGMPKTDETTGLTGYGKLMQYVDVEKKVIMKTEFYDKDLKLIRTQMVKKLEQRNGSWLPVEFFTDDIEEGVTAGVTLFDLETDIEVSPKIFTVRYIKNM